MAAKKKVATPKTVKKSPAKKAAGKTSAKRVVAVKEAFTKTQILNHIAEDTELNRKQVAAVLDALTELMHRHLKKGAAGVFSLPGLLKAHVVRKPATKARKGINPFTKEPTTFKAKPARNVVKVKPLKKLKDMAE